MASLCNVQLRIISGHELPKTDLFSQIDPYVVVSFRGELVGRTVTRDNSPNPVWHEDFFFEVEEDEDGLHGVVTLDLYDEEVGRDEHVGSIVLDLQTLGPETLLDPVELPVTFKTDRRGQKLAKNARRARLALQIVGVGKGFSAYAAELAEVEEALLDEGSGTFLLPVPDAGGVAWVGMRFSARRTQLLLLSTQDPKQAPNPAVTYEWSYPSAVSLRVERVVHRKPMKLMGLRVWSELRAVNVPLGANLSKVRIVERPQRLVDTLDPADVLVSHNYMIGMPFLAAVKELSKRGAHIDTTGQSIWIKMDSNQPQPAQLLQLDYSPAAAADPAAAAPAAAGPGAPNGGGGEGGGGGKGSAAKFPALRICSTSSELNRGYELAYFGGGGRSSTGPMVSVSETFKRPVAVLGGLYQVVHTLELRDAFKGDVLEEVGLGCYEMVKPARTWRFGKLVEAALAGAAGEYDDGGAGGGGGAYGEEGDVGVAGFGALGGHVRGLFACLPCLAPSRGDEYLEESAGTPRRRGGARGAGAGGGSNPGRREGGGGERRQDGRSKARLEEEEKEESDGQGYGKVGRSAGAVGKNNPKAGSGRLGGGANGTHAVDHTPSNLAAAGGGGGRGSSPKRPGNGPSQAGPRGGSGAAGALRSAASVGSSSGQSTQLASYHGRGTGPAARGRPGAGRQRLGSQRSMGVDQDEEDD